MSIIRRESSSTPRIQPFFNGLPDLLFPTSLAQRSLDHDSVTPRVDILEKDKSYVVTADLPGMTKKDVEVSMEGGVLTIESRMEKEVNEEEKGRVICSERYSQRYLRKLDLGSNASMEGVKADFKNGVLTVTVPKLKEKAEKAVRIKIR